MKYKFASKIDRRLVQDGDPSPARMKLASYSIKYENLECDYVLHYLERKIFHGFIRDGISVLREHGLSTPNWEKLCYYFRYGPEVYFNSETGDAIISCEFGITFNE